MLLSETSVPGTDDWWVMTLAEELGKGFPRLKHLQGYVDGTAMVPVEADGAMRAAYIRFVRSSKLILGESAVGARVNRMRPLGFRTAAPGDVNGDSLAMATWKRSNMKVGARDLFWDFGTFGAGYTLNTGSSKASADAKPLIVRSSPWKTLTRQNMVTDWITDVGITVGYDDINQVDIITLYQPGYMRMAMRPAKSSTIPQDGRRWSPGRGWSWVSDPVSLGYTMDNPLVKMTMKGGLGVFEAHTDTLDRINRGILDRLTIQAMQAFRQRGIQGDLPREWPEGHPLAGQVIDYDEIYKAGPAALWMLPVGAEVWESGVTDITPILNGNKDDVKNFAAVTSTPLYILQPDQTNVAAGAAQIADSGIIFAVEEMADRAEAALGLALSLSFQALADPVRAVAGEIETIWAKFARLSITEQASAAAQAKQGGLPQRSIDERIWQMTPAEIAQARQDRTDEAFELAATGA